MDNQEAKKYSNILVIGNGFDLAHNLPTAYDDFIRAIERSIQAPNFSDTESHLEKMPLDISKSEIIKNGFINYFQYYTREVPGWVDLERLMKEIIGYFEEFFEKYQNIIRAGGGVFEDIINITPLNIEKNRLLECLFKFPLFSKNLYQDFDNYNRNRIMNTNYYTDNFGLNKKEVLKLLKNSWMRLLNCCVYICRIIAMTSRRIT